MKIIKAREIKVPSDLAETVDRKAGKPVGKLRDILCNEGKLHQIDKYMLSITLGLQVKKIMESTSLPAEPMTIKRFSDMFNVLMLAYTIGSFRFDEDGELLLGGVRDTAMVAEIMDADEFEFRDGTRIPAQALLPVLNVLNGEKALKGIWDEISKKGVFKRKSLTTDDALHLARTIIDAADELPKSVFFSK